MQEHLWPHNREKLGGLGLERRVCILHTLSTIISFLVQISYELDSAGYSQIYLDSMKDFEPTVATCKLSSVNLQC